MVTRTPLARPMIRLDVPLTMGQVARLLGWPVRRATYWVDSLAKQDPTILMRSPGGHRRTTLAALRRVCPELGAQFATVGELQDVREEQGELANDVRRVAREVRAIRERVVTLEEFRGKAHAWMTRAK